jgi:hypothetical protein
MSRRLAIAGALAAFFLGKAQAQVPLSRRNLMGVWRGTIEAGGVVIGGEIIFQPNGTYRRSNVLGRLMSWASGPYTIAENWIHFEVEDYGPTYFQGVYQYPPPSETWVVESFDGQTIEARIGNVTRVHFEIVG